MSQGRVGFCRRRHRRRCRCRRCRSRRRQLGARGCDAPAAAAATAAAPGGAAGSAPAQQNKKIMQNMLQNMQKNNAENAEYCCIFCMLRFAYYAKTAPSTIIYILFCILLHFLCSLYCNMQNMQKYYSAFCFALWCIFDLQIDAHFFRDQKFRTSEKPYFPPLFA